MTRPLFPDLTQPITRTLRRAKIAALLEGVYSLAPLALAYWFKITSFGSPPAILYAALGITMSVLLMLRTNTAYDRWWEARKLWGKLVNVSRNLVIKGRTLARPDEAELHRFADLVIGFAPILRDHLRSGGPALATATDLRPAQHLPSQRTIEIYETLAGWHHRNLIDGDRLRILDSEAREFLEICGACERILKTPLSRSYRMFLRQGIWLYLIVLPWGIIGELAWWAVPLTIIQAYLFVAIDEIARAIEDPFGLDDDDLDLDGICRTIELSVGSAAGR
ncbi:MAG: hypothetical protein M3552_14785 [Planctomycetota bacterium]|nr:hypothetical protein [Planctomycetota bacterium]